MASRRHAHSRCQALHRCMPVVNISGWSWQGAIRIWLCCSCLQPACSVAGGSGADGHDARTGKLELGQLGAAGFWSTTSRLRS